MISNLRFGAHVRWTMWGIGFHFVGGEGAKGFVLFVGPFAFGLGTER